MHPLQTEMTRAGGLAMCGLGLGMGLGLGLGMQAEVVSLGM